MLCCVESVLVDDVDFDGVICGVIGEIYLSLGDFDFVEE